MKHTFIVLLLGISCLHADCQFKSLLNKVKDKVTSKITGKSADSTSAKPDAGSPATGGQGAGSGSASSGGAASQGVNGGGNAAAAGNGAATGNGGVAGSTGGAGNGVAGGNSGAAGGPGAPQPPVFPTTGKMVKVTTATFGIDTDEDWNNLLRNPMVQDLISRLRQRGVTGTDKEVLIQAMQNQQAYSDIMADMQAKYGSAAAFKPTPAFVFAVFLSSYDYIMTPEYIRAEVGKTDAMGGQGGLAGSMANAFAPGITTIIDIAARKSYTVANFLNILPAAIVEDMSSFQDAFGMVAYLKKYMHQPNIKMQALGQRSFHGYNANVVGVEIPVTPVTDEDGKQSDALLFLHGLLSGNSNDMVRKHYDPSYKLFVETYYSHDLDGKIPAPITGDKNILHIDGFYVGSVLKDEKGNQVTYVLQHLDTGKTMDEGMFLIPDGYEKMTHAQFKERLRAKLRGGK